MIEIKQASKQDTALIETLYLKKIEQLAKKNITQWEKEEVLWETLAKSYKPEQFYLVYRNQQAVGAFVVVDYDPTYWLNDKPKTALYIHKVMVLDEAEKQGIADQILTFFKNLGKEQGYDVVKLDVRAYKTKLRSFYERNGFVLHDIVDLKKGYLTCLYVYPLGK
ncbi:MAG: GNAT family N-acetyltransferase [Erysipelotrichia bacterium]|nr:GNAT family N-acetyltransferase [Erysipelotrichia bacterium]NCC53955.1 GNAT family N-acetyltransferase [Erysipelotrichia bacterium]